MENEDLLWWGYVHENGSIQVKRYWDDPSDIQDARESDLVLRVFTPFKANGREEAINYIINAINHEATRH